MAYTEANYTFYTGHLSVLLLQNFKFSLNDMATLRSLNEVCLIQLVLHSVYIRYFKNTLFSFLELSNKAEIPDEIYMKKQLPQSAIFRTTAPKITVKQNKKLLRY